MPRSFLPTQSAAAIRERPSALLLVGCIMGGAMTGAAGCAQRSPEPPSAPKGERPIEAASPELDLSRRPASGPNRGVASGASGSPRQFTGQSRLERFVELSLLTSVAEAKAGQRLWLAAHFRIHPSAHIYWQNPGEAGLATRAIFHVPDGFRAGPVRYPGPERFETEPGVASFGYSGETALLVELDVPELIDEAGSYRLEVEASWLSCSDICIKESATAHSMLSVTKATHDDLAPQTNSLQHFVDQLPTPFGDLPQASHSWNDASDSRELRLAASGAVLTDFFPTQRPAIGEKLPRVEATSGSSAGVESTPTELRVTFGPKLRQPSVRGVVRGEVGASTRFFELEVERP